MNKLFLIGLIAVVLTFGIQVQVHAKTYYLHLPSPIKEGNLTNQVKVLENAKKGDVVKISTDSPGGEVQEMLKMIIAMKESKATTHCFIDRFAASAAALITVSCDNFTMNEGSLILFHMPSRIYELGAVELFRDVITVDDMCPAHAVDAERFAAFMEALGVRRMMTSMQWNAMIHGKDIVLTPTQIINNLGGN
jgi:membrane-bound ClpP family serine protease